jgi:hypothetical protein
MAGDAYPAAHIDQIEWLPDGKHIRFAYQGMLYVTEAAEPKHW